MKGLVIKLIGGIYTVLNLETNEQKTLTARGKLRYLKVDKFNEFNKSNTKSKKVETKTIKLSPKVGDYVIYNDDNIIDILKRKNELIRPDVCNVDQILLVFASKNPDFNFLLLDKFIALIEKENIKPVIIITKIDLLDNLELSSLKFKMSYYEKIGYKVIYTSKKTNEGINDIYNIIDNNISVLSGQTGAGKSSLMNMLDNSLTLKTDEISKALGRGKHTTRHVELYKIKNGMIADTPGFSKLDFYNWDINKLKDVFIDFKKQEINCKFRGCKHINEPDCYIKKMVDEKNIPYSRYVNYLTIYEEIKLQKTKY